ncbi:MAG: hypothetical protein RLZZ297_322 [Chloroflexota bacterium]|jgi:hypothetical protein
MPGTERYQPNVATVEAQVVARIRRAGRGSVWCVERFAGVAPRNTLDQTLRRLAQKGTLERIAHGVYHYGHPHPLTGTAPATIAATIVMLADAGYGHLVPIGATAAAVYDLAAPSGVVTYGAHSGSRRVVTPWWELRVTTVAPRFVVDLHPQTATVIQALRWVGRRSWSAHHQATLAAALTANGRAIVAAQAAAAPDWMHSWLRALC